MISHLKDGLQFMDVGAHYGYFSLLASYLVGPKGKVHAFEASSKSFALLRENASSCSNITPHHTAITNAEGNMDFYEFPNLYSEYNSFDIEQFKDQSWIKESTPSKVSVPATTIDKVVSSHSFHPDLIKIDVEGGEYNVINGGLEFIKNSNTILVMEYLNENRYNENHHKAVMLLKELGYRANFISASGDIVPVDDIDAYLSKNGLESDNFVFKR